VVRALPTLLVVVEEGGLPWDLAELGDLTLKAVKRSNYTWVICPSIRMRRQYVPCLKSMVKLPIVSCPQNVIAAVCVDLHS